MPRCYRTGPPRSRALVHAHHAVRLAALAAALALAAPARAHETLHEIRRGAAIAVKAFESDGDLLADVPFEVYAPADPKVPWQTGRTDRGGWLAFVPDAPGTWRVRVIEEGGHGLDLRIEATAAAGGAAAPGAPGEAGWSPTSLAFVLRPVAGVLVIGAIFGALALAYRKKGRRP